MLKYPKLVEEKLESVYEDWAKSHGYDPNDEKIQETFAGTIALTTFMKKWTVFDLAIRDKDNKLVIINPTTKEKMEVEVKV